MRQYQQRPQAHVGGRHDPVARAQRPALAVEHLAADVGHAADVLVAADERVLDLALVRRAGVLHRLAAEGVLVGAADARHRHLEHDGAGLGFGKREVLDLEPSRLLHDGGLDAMIGAFHILVVSRLGAGVKRRVLICPGHAGSVAMERSIVSWRRGE